MIYFCYEHNSGQHSQNKVPGSVNATSCDGLPRRQLMKEEMNVLPSKGKYVYKEKTHLSSRYLTYLVGDDRFTKTITVTKEK